VKPNIRLAETTTPDGGRLILYEYDESFCIRLNGQILIHSAAAASELLLGELAAQRLSRLTAPRILIGGLGLGFTLKSVLDRVGPAAKVQVAELVPKVVDWNRQFMSRLNGALLDDPRVEVLVADVWKFLTRVSEPSYDALLFDVDNGPKALVQKQNARLYSRNGLDRIAAALKAGGRAVFWSADPAPEFSHRLVGAGFRVKTVPARLYATAQHCAGTIFVADKYGSSLRDAGAREY
jgi:spermidine synthase